MTNPPLQIPPEWKKGIEVETHEESAKHRILNIRNILFR